MPSRRSTPFAGRPSTSTSPDVGLRKPMARLSKVDLPQPLGPTTATISSSLQENDTSRSTSIAPRRPGNEKLILRNSSIVAFSFKHDLFRNPASTFRDHALGLLARVGDPDYRLADAERLGVDQDKGDTGPRIAAVGPGMIGAALHHHIAGLQL